MLCTVDFLKILLVLSVLLSITETSCIDFYGQVQCTSLEELLKLDHRIHKHYTRFKVSGESQKSDVFVCDEAIFENFTSANDVTLKNIKILHISDECFKGMESIEELTLDSNYLPTINMKNFDAMKLSFLKINENLITRMDFSDAELPYLKILHAYENRLKSIEITSKNAPKITRIDLGTNHISSFQIESQTLEDLTLRSNRIKSFNGSNLAVPNLQWLDLAENFLTRITPDMFTNCLKPLKSIVLTQNLLTTVNFPESYSEIETVYLSYNDLKDLHFLSNNSVHRLDLNSNKIRQLTQRSLKIEKLTFFSCTRCAINEIGQFFFANASETLEELDLDYNNIRCANIFKNRDSNFGLVRLKMSHNWIKRIGRNDFRRLTKIEEMYFDNNDITVIEEGAFNTTIALKRLRLTENMLFKLPENLFEKLISLQYLFLSGNNMPYFHIPGWQEEKGMLLNSSSPLNNLKMLHISKNPLQCQCVRLIRYWAKWNNIELEIHGYKTRQGIYPFCIVNEGQCKKVEESFIEKYWHLFNYITLKNILYANKNAIYDRDQYEFMERIIMPIDFVL